MQKHAARFLSLAFFIFTTHCSNSNDNSSVVRLTNELSKSTSGSGIDTVLILTAWVHSSLAPADDVQPSSPEDSLNMLVGACGIRDLVLQAVLNRMGFQTRRTSFFDVPVQVGHTATEVYVEGRWIFVDASIGGYFVDPLHPEQPLSIAEARALSSSVQIMRATTISPWQKKWLAIDAVSQAYNEGTLYEAYSENTIEHPFQPGRIVFYITETYLTSLYTNLDHPTVTFSIPIDLDSNPSGQIGTKDGTYADMNGVVFDESGLSFYDAALWLVGSFVDYNTGGVMEPTHKFEFSSSSTQTAQLKIHFTAASGASSRLIVHTSSGTPTVHWSGDTATVSFTVTAPSTDLEVSLSSGYPELFTLDAISWQ